MLNSKLEKVLMIIVWYITLLVITFIKPVPNSNFETKVIYCSICFFITVIVFRIYVKKRDNFVFKKSRQYIALNKFSEDLIFIDKCINKNKKIVWLKYEKLFILAMQGEIFNFQNYYDELKSFNYILEKKYNYSISLFENLFSYLTNGITPQITSSNQANTTTLEQMVWLLCEKERMASDEIIKYAIEIYNAPFHLFKSVSAIILAEAYRKLESREKEILFVKKAKEYAPSQEVLDWGKYAGERYLKQEQRKTGSFMMQTATPFPISTP